MSEEKGFFSKKQFLELPKFFKQYSNKKEKKEAIQKAATLWNVGKVLSSEPGE